MEQIKIVRTELLEARCPICGSPISQEADSHCAIFAAGHIGEPAPQPSDSMTYRCGITRVQIIIQEPDPYPRHVFMT